jgi:hypothetical protein
LTVLPCSAETTPIVLVIVAGFFGGNVGFAVVVIGALVVITGTAGKKKQKSPDIRN